MEIPRAAVMILCLAAGFGVSFALRPGHPGKKTRTEEPVIGTTTGSSAPSRSRTLHLESLWSQRGGTFQTAAASQRVLAAVTSGNWNDASKKEAVALLLKDPGFINTIWNKADPATRNAMMGELIKVLTQDTPVTSLEVLDAGKFDFSQIPEIGFRMANTVRHGRSPIDALDAAKRNRHKLGQREFEKMLWGAGYPEANARVMLADTALGIVYPQREIETACAVLLRKDGALPPGTENLEAVKASLARKKAKEDTAAWLKGEKTLTADELRALDAKELSEALILAQSYRGNDPDATQLELLAAAGHGKAQTARLVAMVHLGRTENALRLLDEIKDMPASKPRRDELISAVATSIYESGGDVGEAARLMQGIADGPVYWKSMEKVLTNWVTDDPPAGRAYLEEVIDPDLRRSLEEALAKASLDP